MNHERRAQAGREDLQLTLDENKRLLDENAALRAALEFYADSENWKPKVYANDRNWIPESDASREHGNLAKAALAIYKPAAVRDEVANDG